MATIKTWVNGANGGEVKRVIEQNFNTLAKHLSSNILTLTTQERKLLTTDYLSEGLRVYDKDLELWFKYTGHSWIECPAEYTCDISTSTWVNNIIFINSSLHHIKNPIVQMYIKDNNGYSPVIGGVSIDTDFNITLLTDMPFAGKVVVK